jgi:hypothetical protein
MSNHLAPGQPSTWPRSPLVKCSAIGTTLSLLLTNMSWRLWLLLLVACLSLLAGSHAFDGMVGIENEMPASNSDVANYDFVADCQSILELLTIKRWEIRVADWKTTLSMLLYGDLAAHTRLFRPYKSASDLPRAVPSSSVVVWSPMFVTQLVQARQIQPLSTLLQSLRR